MSGKKILRILLDEGPLVQARAGGHNFLNRVTTTLAAHGYSHEFLPNTIAEKLLCATRSGWSLHFMQKPPTDHAFVFRCVYFLPFWQIDPSEKRWEWHVAKADFHAAKVNRDAATLFAANWRNRRYPGQTEKATREGFVFVPLQGRLLEQRSFQSAAPLAMLRAVLAHVPDRHVVATLHPKETYSAKELCALDALTAQEPRLTIRRGGSEELLRRCNFVVTQNSSAAFAGYFFRKPAVLFARIDFHHIAASVPHLGEVEAFRAVQAMDPDYEGYLWWFLRIMSLNAGRDDVGDKIVAAFRRGGMEI